MLSVRHWPATKQATWSIEPSRTPLAHWIWHDTFSNGRAARDCVSWFGRPGALRFQDVPFHELHHRGSSCDEPLGIMTFPMAGARLVRHRAAGQCLSTNRRETFTGMPWCTGAAGSTSLKAGFHRDPFLDCSTWIGDRSTGSLPKVVGLLAVEGKTAAKEGLSMAGSLVEEQGRALRTTRKAVRAPHPPAPRE
mgnify:CR=1 FL=1